MRAILVGLLVVLSLVARADYLKLYRNTSIKATAESSGIPVKAVKAGELLILLDSGQQTRGYYHVQYPGSDIEGYIYRTLVKRMEGNFPTFYDAENAVAITIIDVGPGMSAIINLPNGNVMLYDAGAYSRTYDYLKTNHPTLSEIDYLILSHTDADHWGSVKLLAENYTINNVLRTDFREGKRSAKLEDGIEALVNHPPTEQDINLSITPITPGALLYNKEGVQLYFIMGFGTLPAIDDWDDLDTSKQNNGVSIVVKLVYGDHSILFTGDAVGREDGKDGCIASEKFMLDSLSIELLQSNVLVAAHHGADNASCLEFINAISPEYVVFPAGHHSGYRHPRLTTANRYIKDYGLAVENIFRTDRGDYESGGTEIYKKHWNSGTSIDDRDVHNDDHISIVFKMNRNIQIGYKPNN